MFWRGRGAEREEGGWGGVYVCVGGGGRGHDGPRYRLQSIYVTFA